MKEYHSLSHTRWDCKYHVVFIPKRRKKSFNFKYSPQVIIVNQYVVSLLVAVLGSDSIDLFV